jgi:hypothetical protein
MDVPAKWREWIDLYEEKTRQRYAHAPENFTAWLIEWVVDLDRENTALKVQLERFADRIAGQSEALSKKAEKS